MAIRYAKETCITNAKNMDVKKIIKVNARAPYDRKALVMLLCGFGTSFFVCPMVAYHEGLPSAVYIVMAAIPGIFIYLGVFFYFMRILRKNLGELKSCFKIYNLSYESIEEDMHEHMTAYDYVFLGKRLFVGAGYGAFAVPYENIVWAYLKEEKKKGKSFFYIYIYTDDRQERKNPVTDVQCGEAILRKLAESAPYILLGYTDEIANMYQFDFNRMLEVVCQRKACQSQEDHSTVENYTVINEFAVTWKKYVEWYFDTLVQSGLIWFKVFWGIAAFYSIMPLFVNFSFILFLFGIFCLYRIFIRDYIRVRKFYRRGVQYFGKNRMRKIMVSDTHIMTQEGNTTIRYNKKDIVQLKEKGDRIWLVMKDKTAVRMYKSALVGGSWERCKELFTNPVKEDIQG